MSKKTPSSRWRRYELTDFDIEAVPNPAIDSATARSKSERREMRSLERRRRFQEGEVAERPAPQPKKTWQKILADDKAKRIANHLKKYGY
jgi:hypothetical protein